MERLAEQRLTDVAPLRALADDIAAAVTREDSRGYIEGDRAFHLALISRLDNPMLTKMIMELRDGMRLYGMDSAAGRQRQVASVEEHHQLIDLSAAGETGAIAKLIVHHIRSGVPTSSLAGTVDPITLSKVRRRAAPPSRPAATAAH